MPGGRPTAYDESHCEAVVEFLKDGYSLTAFAGHVGVARSTVFKWMDDNPEFSDSVKRGQAAAVLWWEDANRKLATSGTGNATACVFGLKNRAAEDWRDVSRQEHTGADGAPIETRVKTDASSLTDEQLEALASIKVQPV